MKKKYSIGQEIVVMAAGGKGPTSLIVEKVGTKYISARASNGFFRQVASSTGVTKEGEQVWCSRREFYGDVTVLSNKIKEVKNMIDSFDWSKCSMLKLIHIAESFDEDEVRLAAKAFMRKIGMID